MRYRYITCGECNIHDPLSEYRLVSIRYLDDEDFAIRVEIPHDIKLSKLPCDTYSIADTDCKIIDVNPKVIYRNYDKTIDVDYSLTKKWNKHGRD